MAESAKQREGNPPYLPSPLCLCPYSAIPILLVLFLVGSPLREYLFGELGCWGVLDIPMFTEGTTKKTSRGESVRFVSSPSAQNQPVWVAVKSHTPGEKSTNMLEGRPYLITAYNRKRSTQVCVLTQLMGTPEGRRGLLQTRTLPGSPVRLNLRPSRL